jgi:hypothetical protein
LEGRWSCPFEGCSYKGWTADKATVLYDTWKPEQKKIGKIAAGEKVTAITGTVITHRPGLVRMDRDLPAHHLTAGDIILTYAYRGEGDSAVWFKGNYYDEFSIGFTKWPDGSGCGGSHCAATYLDLGEKVWWAQITLQSGLVGWVNMSRSGFAGRSVWD